MGQAIYAGKADEVITKRSASSKETRIHLMSNSVTTNPPAARPTASTIAVGRTGREREKYLEEQLRLVTNHGPVYLVHCDREHRYTFANRAYAERYGLTTQSIIGKHVSEVAGSAAYNS